MLTPPTRILPLPASSFAAFPFPSFPCETAFAGADCAGGSNQRRDVNASGAIQH
jgi:hypothetical protein